MLRKQLHDSRQVEQLAGPAGSADRCSPELQMAPLFMPAGSSSRSGWYHSMCRHPSTADLQQRWMASMLLIPPSTDPRKLPSPRRQVNSAGRPLLGGHGAKLS